MLPSLLHKDHVGWVTRVPVPNKKKGRVKGQIMDGQKVSFLPVNLRVPSDVEEVAQVLQGNTFYKTFVQSNSFINTDPPTFNTSPEIESYRDPVGEPVGQEATVITCPRNVSDNQELENSEQVTSETHILEVHKIPNRSRLEATRETNNTMDMSATIKDASTIVLNLIKEMKVLQLYVKKLNEQKKSTTLRTISNDYTNLHDRIQYELDRYFNSLETEWVSPMTFPMHTGDDCISTATTMDVDICAFIGWLPQADHIKGYYAYFNRNELPPCTNPSTVFDEQGSFSMLRACISRAAIANGFSIVMNGNTNKKSLANRKAFPMGSEPPYMSRTFMCDRY